MNNRVLFVGNSGTYVNDMHKIFEHIAQKSGFDCLCEKEAPDSMRFVQHADPEEPAARIFWKNLKPLSLQSFSFRKTEMCF